jgi:hypothetical protein
MLLEGDPACDWSIQRCSHETVVEQIDHRAPASRQAMETAMDCWATSEEARGIHVGPLVIAAAVGATVGSPRPAAMADDGTRDGAQDDEVSPPTG